MFTIYLHRNLLNNKVYIGLTKFTMHRRWLYHISKSKNPKQYFHTAILKYGIDCWEHEILETCHSLKDAENAEIKWIQYYKSNDKNFGYNQTSGGKTTVFTDDIKQKISSSLRKYYKENPDKSNSKKLKEYYKNNQNAFLNKTHTEQTKKILSEKLKNFFMFNENKFKGKKHSLESKKKMSEKAKLRKYDFKEFGFGGKKSEETKEKIRKLKLGKPTGKITKEDILSFAINCKYKKEIAKNFNCTPANISFLIKHFNIKDEIENLLKNNKGSK